MNIVSYLEGRKVYLRSLIAKSEEGSMKERCAQARMNEISELIDILKFLEEKGENE